LSSSDFKKLYNIKRTVWRLVSSCKKRRSSTCSRFLFPSPTPSRKKMTTLSCLTRTTLDYTSVHCTQRTARKQKTRWVSQRCMKGSYLRLFFLIVLAWHFVTLGFCLFLIQLQINTLGWVVFLICGPITSRSHTHPSHSLGFCLSSHRQSYIRLVCMSRLSINNKHSSTSRLLTSSLSSGGPVPQGTQCIRGV
jgi:hypothetical protein